MLCISTICFLVAGLSLPEPLLAASSPDKLVVQLRVESNNYNFGAERLVKQLLNRAGFGISTGAAPDATLYVEVKGESLSRTYGYGEGVRLSTGARITGTLLLEVPNRPATEKHFTGMVPPPFSISVPRNSDDPPFAEAFRKSDFHIALGTAIGDTLGPKFAVAYWLGAMTIPEYLAAAMDALGGLGAAAVGPVLDGVRGDRIYQADASRALARIDDVTLLFAAINDGDPRVRACVVEVLGLVGDSSAKQLLVRVLREDQAETVRAGALESLTRIMARLGASDLTPFLEALKDVHASVRRVALKGLEDATDPTVISAFEKALADDPDATVRKAAAEALGKSRRVTAVTALQRSLKVDKDADVRLSALLSISKLDRSEVASLIAALQDLDKDVRENAAEALAKTGDQRSIGPLIAAMYGQPISMRRVIAGVLKKMTNQDFGMDYQAWSKWWEGQPKSLR